MRLHGNLDDEFPLYVWQTGSGTQRNMNVNVMPNYQERKHFVTVCCQAALEICTP
jgi:fumarate hydratase class II